MLPIPRRRRPASDIGGPSATHDSDSEEEHQAHLDEEERKLRERAQRGRTRCKEIVKGIPVINLGARAWLIGVGCAVALVIAAELLMVALRPYAEPPTVPIKLRRPPFPPAIPFDDFLSYLRYYGTPAEIPRMWSGVACGTDSVRAMRRGDPVTVTGVADTALAEGEMTYIMEWTPGVGGTVRGPAGDVTVQEGNVQRVPTALPGDGCGFHGACLSKSRGVMLLRPRYEIFTTPMVYDREVKLLPWSPPAMELGAESDHAATAVRVSAPDVCFVVLRSPENADPSALLYGTLLPAASTFAHLLGPKGRCQKAAVFAVALYPATRTWGTHLRNYLFPADVSAKVILTALPPPGAEKVGRQAAADPSEPWVCPDYVRVGADDCQDAKGAVYDNGCFHRTPLLRYQDMLWANYRLVRAATPDHPEALTGRRWAVISAPVEGPSVWADATLVQELCRAAGFQPQLWDPLRAEDAAAITALNRAQVVIGVRGAGLAVAALWMRPGAVVVEAVAEPDKVKMQEYVGGGPWDPAKGGEFLRKVAHTFRLPVRRIDGRRMAGKTYGRLRAEGTLPVMPDESALLHALHEARKEVDAVLSDGVA